MFNGRHLTYFFIVLMSMQITHAGMKGYLDNVKVISGDRVQIHGWACLQGSKREVMVHLYAGTSTKDRKIIKGVRANLKSEVGVKNACRDKGNHRFKTVLTSAEYEKAKGKKVWAFAISPNALLVHSGKKTVPVIKAKALKVKGVSENYAKSFRPNFDREKKADFNNDGWQDTVSCQGTPKLTKDAGSRYRKEYEREVKVRIIDGKSKKTLYEYKFEGFKRFPAYSRRIINANCEIAFLENNRPSVIIGSHYENYYQNNPNGPKYRKAPQRIILNRGGQLTGMQMKVNNKALVSITKDVQCIELDHHKVTNGAYCFVASYPTFEERHRPAGVTYTSLIKLSRSGSSLTVKDVTKETGLIWDGVGGTHVAKFPKRNNGPHYGVRRDNANVISGDFLDANQDGLFDLFVVGQHMTFYKFAMVTTNNSVGFKFVTNVISRPSSKGGPTEFTKVRALPKDFKKKCIYVSGEGKSIAGSLNYVNDYLKCYHDSSWVNIDIPNEFTSNGFNAQFEQIKNGNILIRSKKRLKSSYATKFSYFELE